MNKKIYNVNCVLYDIIRLNKGHIMTTQSFTQSIHLPITNWNIELIPTTHPITTLVNSKPPIVFLAASTTGKIVS